MAEAFSKGDVSRREQGGHGIWREAGKARTRREGAGVKDPTKVGTRSLTREKRRCPPRHEGARQALSELRRMINPDGECIRRRVRTIWSKSEIKQQRSFDFYDQTLAHKGEVARTIASVLVRVRGLSRNTSLLDHGRFAISKRALAHHAEKEKRNEQGNDSGAEKFQSRGMGSGDPEGVSSDRTALASPRRAAFVPLASFQFHHLSRLGSCSFSDAK